MAPFNGVSADCWLWCSRTHTVNNLLRCVLTCCLLHWLQFT